MKTNANIINLNVSKVNSTFSITVGAIKLSLELDEIMDNIDLIFRLLDKYASEEQIEDAKEVIQMLTEHDFMEIYKIGFMDFRSHFNMETGKLTLTKYEVTDCVLDIFKYLDLLKSIIQRDQDKYEAIRKQRELEEDEAEIQYEAKIASYTRTTEY